MIGNVQNWIARRLSVSAETQQQQAVIQKRFSSLKKQFPWVYGIFAVNLLGIQFSIVPSDYDAFNPTIYFLAVIAVRLIYWFRLGNRWIESSRIQRELIKSYVVATVVCAMFCVWVICLYGTQAGTRPASLVIFASLTTVGVFYGLSGFPAAAKAPIYFLSLPLSVLFIMSGDPPQIAIGLAQSFLMLLMLRMLSTQDRAFVRLVSTRFESEARRLTAVQAEQSAVEKQVHFSLMAHTDPLTGLRNRRGLMASLERDDVLSHACALIILDLDGFKPINDTYGHPAGDHLLIEVGARLSAVIGVEGVAARLGGDEFALLFRAASVQNARDFAEKTTRLLSEPYIIAGRKMCISACAGVSWRESGKAAPSALMSEADIALYSSKKRGRGVVEPFTSAMQGEIQRKTMIEQALREPGLIERIDLAYQPIFNLHSLELRSFEALARWEHSELGWISPAEFIPLTEQISAIEQLSDSLLRRAATAALTWPAAVKLSFNLSPIQLSTAGTGNRLLRIIKALGFPAERLQVEVTETALLADFDVARANLALLRHAGASIVLDDFGAGYASISYLREINFDAIKLDGSLVTSITDAGPALPLLRGVLALCQAMGRQCIAEHIETDAQLNILRQLGCRYGQGYGLAKPMTDSSATELARTKVINISDFKKRGMQG